MLNRKASYFEDKVKHLTELLSDLESEIDILGFASGGSNASDSLDTQKQKYVVEIDNGEDKAIADSPDSSADKNVDKEDMHKPFIEIDMAGAESENGVLSSGWWDSEGNSRWSGKDNKHGTVTFTLSEIKSCILTVRFFVPEHISDKHVRIIVNGSEVLDIVPEGSGIIEKNIELSEKVVRLGENNIMFKASFWSPKKVDPKLKDEGSRSIAFDFISIE